MADSMHRPKKKKKKVHRPELDRRKMAILIEDSDFSFFKLSRSTLQQCCTIESLGKAPSEVFANLKLLAEFCIAKLKISEEISQPFLHYWIYLVSAKDKGPAKFNPVRAPMSPCPTRYKLVCTHTSSVQFSWQARTVTMHEFTKALSQAPAPKHLKSDGLAETCWKNNARKYRVMQDLGLTPLALLEKFEAEARPLRCSSQAEATTPSHSNPEHIRVDTLRIAYQRGPLPRAPCPPLMVLKVLPEQHSVYTLAELLCAKYVELTRPGDGCVFDHMWTLSAGALGAATARRDKVMRLSHGLPRTLNLYALDLISKLEEDDKPMTYVGPHSASRELGIPVTEKRPGPVLSSAFPSWGKGASFCLTYDMGTESHFVITCLEEGTMLATDWVRSTRTDPALAFGVGDRVQVKMSNGWQDGTVTSLWFKGGLYSIKTDKTGRLSHAC